MLFYKQHRVISSTQTKQGIRGRTEIGVSSVLERRPLRNRGVGSTPTPTANYRGLIMDSFFEKLNHNLRPAIEKKFQGVIIGNAEDLTQEHETMVTGLRLAPVIFRDETVAGSPELLQLILNEIEDTLLNSGSVLKEFLFLKPIDRIGNGMYYTICVVGKFKS